MAHSAFQTPPKHTLHAFDPSFVSSFSSFFLVFFFFATNQHRTIPLLLCVLFPECSCHACCCSLNFVCLYNHNPGFSDQAWVSASVSCVPKKKVPNTHTHTHTHFQHLTAQRLSQTDVVGMHKAHFQIGPGPCL